MSKQLISIFFSILFLGLITAPSIIIAIDADVDVSILYNVSEEEEENKSINLVVTEQKETTESIYKEIAFLRLDYLFKSYTKPALNLISPPPEIFIL
ncbi:hypothetical protein [Mesoflavibacter sp. SCSIO 43206]|uniref:hypothetical protein n=1 Tax=Mesoflavibacter sp. SCSIO 43206 TaxID=2779362 RepID=UPI0021033CC9|nr:hypothetical protein [Mesoflavibacter sp. SCSIO 43206]